MKLFSFKQGDDCQIHGGHGRKANRALWAMVIVSLSLIVWHVWVYGPGGRGALPDAGTDSFPRQLLNEFGDLLFNRRGILAELWEVFPYFIAGILIAGWLRTYKVAVRLQGKLRRYGALSIVVASLVGIITPLCACGTVTTAISLLFAGLPLAPVMSLMITSSLLSPSTYLITLNDLGPEWTVIRTIAALFMGIFAGGVTLALRRWGFETRTLFIDGAIVRGDFHDEDYPDERLRCNCRQKLGNRVAVRTGNNFLIFLAKSAEMLWSVGKYIIVGVAMGAVVERYMPTGWIYHFFGQGDPLNIIWVTAVSVPMFLHQLSASGILAHVKGALGGTLDSGAALAFMIGGPVTAVPTMVLFWTIFKKRVFALYLFVCLAGTLLISYGFQWTLFAPGVDTGNELLRGVGTLPGVQSVSLTKSDSAVRMVLDPGGIGIIACFRNDLDGRGGAVFDGGYGRFPCDNAVHQQVRRYILNLAGWLADNSSSPSGRDILVYDGSDREEPLLGRRTLDELSAAGFRVSFLRRGDAVSLKEALRRGAGQLWFFIGSGQTAEEEQAVLQFNRDGNGLLLVPGGVVSGDQALAGINRIAATFGVTFSAEPPRQGDIATGGASHLLAEASALLGRLLKLVHKA